MRYLAAHQFAILFYEGIGVKHFGDDDRQVATAGKAQRLDLGKRAHRESRAIPAPDANAELATSMKVILFFFLYDKIYLHNLVSNSG